MSAKSWVGVPSQFWVIVILAMVWSGGPEVMSKNNLCTVVVEVSSVGDFNVNTDKSCGIKIPFNLL